MVDISLSALGAAVSKVNGAEPPGRLLKLAVETDDGTRTVEWCGSTCPDVGSVEFSAAIDSALAEVLPWPAGYHLLIQPCGAAGPSDVDVSGLDGAGWTGCLSVGGHIQP